MNLTTASARRPDATPNVHRFEGRTFSNASAGWVTESGDDELIVEVNREQPAKRRNVNREEFAEGQPENRATCVED